MLQKIALFVASLAATLTLAVALAAAGFAPGATPAATSAASTVTAADAMTVDAAPPIQVDKVYVAAPEQQKTITVHKVVKSSGGEGETENEGSGGDD